MNAIAPASGLPRRCAPDGTTSHSTKPASWQVAGYRNDCLFGSGSSGLGYSPIRSLDTLAANVHHAYTLLKGVFIMVRTQIYLTEQEQTALRSLAGSMGRSQSELIRDAVDRFIESAQLNDRDQVLCAAAGLWADDAGRPDFVALRGEADRVAPDMR